MVDELNELTLMDLKVRRPLWMIRSMFIPTTQFGRNCQDNVEKYYFFFLKIRQATKLESEIYTSSTHENKNIIIE